MSRPEPTPVSASVRLKRRALASLCALSFATGTVAVVPAPTANAVAASVHKNQYANAPKTRYASYNKIDAPGTGYDACNVSVNGTLETNSRNYAMRDNINGVGRIMAFLRDEGNEFGVEVVAQMGNDQGDGDAFPRYRETAEFRAVALKSQPLKPIAVGDTVEFRDSDTDELNVTDAEGDITGRQTTINLDGNQNTVMAWKFDNNSPHIQALARRIGKTGQLTLQDVFKSVQVVMEANLAPFPDENAFCQVMNTKSTPVTMLADGEPHPFEITLENVDPDDYDRLDVVVVDENGVEIKGATAFKDKVVLDDYGFPIAMQTQVTLPKDDERYHDGQGVFLQVFAIPRDGDDKRAAAGPNKGTGLSDNYAYSREDAEAEDKAGKGLYDTNMKIGGLHAVHTPSFSAEHGANSGEPGETISAQIVDADQEDKGVKASQPFLGDNNPTFSLGGEIEYDGNNQGDNDWTNPQVDPVTGEATITVGAGAKGGDLAYVPVKVTNSDGSSFTIRATFTSKQPAPVALQPAFKAGPVGDTLKATPKYTKNGQPYIDSTTVQIVGADENTDGKTLTVDGQGTWRVDENTGEFSFTPVAGFVGDPTPIQYTAKGVKGGEPIQPAEVMFSYYPLETREATTFGPVDAKQNSTDNNSPGDSGRTTAQLFPGLPTAWYGKDGSPVKFQLVDPNGTPVQQGQALEIPNVGTYTIDQNTGVVSFKAAENFLDANETEKEAAKVGIRTVGLTNAERGGESAELTAYYRPTVEKQSFALPNARENGQTGQPQSATPNYRAFSTDRKTVKMVPVEGNELSEDGKTMTVPDQGTWTVDDNGVFTFTPVTGFVGSPAPVRYEANSRSGQKAEGTGQVAIFYPDPRTLPANTSAAQGVTQESDDIHDRNEGKATKDMFPTLPTAWYGEEGSPVKFDLVDPSGNVVEKTNDKGQPTFTVENVGTYTLDPVKGLATFTPVPSFTGPAPRVEIQTKGITGGEELKAAYNPFVYPVGVEIPSAFERADQVGSPVDVTPIYERTNEDGTRDELASVNPETIQIVADGLPDGSVISEDKKSVTVPGEGSWIVDNAGKFTFTPLAPDNLGDPDPAKRVQGFTGNPTPISYLAKNVQDIEALVPGQVTALYPTIATDDAITTGDKGQTQLSTDTQDGVEDKGLTIAQMFPNLNPEWAKAGMELVDLQEQGSLNDDKTVLTVEGKGTYTLDKEAGTISFAPAEDFQGTAPKVGIKLTGVDTQPVAAYTPIVRPFAKPAEDAVVVLPSKVQRGKTGEPVSLTPPLADNIDKSTIKILNTDGNEVDELDVDGGTWTVDKQTGEFTFTPNEGYLGTPAPVQYTAKDRFGTKAKEPGEVSVQYPEQRTADSATSDTVDKNQTSRAFTGEGGMFPTLPAWESNTFALEGADDNGKIVRPGVGTFSIDNGRVLFDPEPGFQGKADPVTVVATTQDGTELRANYEPTVIGPKNEFVLPSVSKEGQLGEAVKVTPAYPANVDPSTVEIDGAGQDGKKVVAGEGTWSVDEKGEFTFTPEPGFSGNPTPVAYTAKSTDGKEAAKPGYVIVSYPAEAKTFALPSDAVNKQPGQKHTFDLGKDIDASTLKLVDASGNQVTALTTDEGTWAVENGAVTFTPQEGFEGATTPVRYTAKSKNGVEAAYPGFLAVTYPKTEQPTPTTTTPATPTSTTTPATPTPTTPATPATPTSTTTPATPSSTTTPATPTSPVTSTTTPATPTDPTTTTTPATPVPAPQIPDTVKTAPVGETVKQTPRYADNIDRASVRFDNGETTKVVPGEGTWTVDETGEITFTPADGFVSNPAPVEFTAKDKDGRPAEPAEAYVVYTVAPPTAPKELPNSGKAGKTGEPVTQTPAYTTQINRSTVRILDNGEQVERLVVPGEGTWTVKDGEFTFTPADGFEGNPTPITYTAKDRWGRAYTEPGQVNVIYPQIAQGPKLPNSKTAGIEGSQLTQTPAYGSDIDTASIRILDANNVEVTELVVPGEGTWLLDGGKFTFTPSEDLKGDPTPIRYTGSNTAGVKASQPGEVAVEYVAAPETSNELPNSGRAGEPGEAVVQTPGYPGNVDKQSVRILDGDTEVTELTVPGQGVWKVAGGTFTFTPERTFDGSPDPIRYTAKDTAGKQFAQPAEVTVTYPKATAAAKPVVPASGEIAYAGEVVKQTPPYPANVDPATVRIVDPARGEVTELVVPGEGIWTVKDGEFTFTPADGFTSNPTPVKYTAADKDGVKASNVAEVRVRYLAIDATKELPSSGAVGKQGETVTQTPAYRQDVDRSTVRILDGDKEVTELTVPGEGTWSVDEKGEFTFTPEKDFFGTPNAIWYTAKANSGRSLVPGNVVVAYPMSVKADPSVTPKPTDPSATPTDPTPTDPSATPTDPSATPTVITPVTDAQGSSGSEVIGRCVANAVRSPILWALPIGLLAAVGGPIVEPYVGQFQAQLNGINAELNRLWRENTKQDDRDWGIFGNGGNRRRNNDNEQFGELMRQVEAFNAQIQQVAGRPEVQELGKIAGGILGVVALSAVMYDWCTTDPGKAWTSIDFEGGSSADSKRNATRYTRNGSLTTVAPTTVAPTTVAPTTVTEPTTR